MSWSPPSDACELTLDPNTAYRNLSLSEENRKLTRRTEDQPYPDHPERFEGWPQVLCREGLSGRCYWEAEWSGGGCYCRTERERLEGVTVEQRETREGCYSRTGRDWRRVLQ